MRSALVLLLVWLQLAEAAAAAFIHHHPSIPVRSVSPVRHKCSFQTTGPRPSFSLVRRHFTVGGEAPDGPTLQETFNAATAIAAAVVGGLVALEVRGA